LGLPKEWQFSPGLFDVFPHLHEQIRNALLTASGDELEGARAACRLLSRIFDNPENWRRGAIVIAGAPLPWRAIKLVGLIWPAGEYPTCMITQLDEKPTATPFPRFLTVRRGRKVARRLNRADFDVDRRVQVTRRRTIRIRRLSIAHADRRDRRPRTR
jgi:hypothetical protein